MSEELQGQWSADSVQRSVDSAQRTALSIRVGGAYIAGVLGEAFIDSKMFSHLPLLLQFGIPFLWGFVSYFVLTRAPGRQA